MIKCSIALLLALAGTAILAGCGDGEAAIDLSEFPAIPSPEPNSLSRAKYIAKANQECDTSWTQMLNNFAERYQSTPAGNKFVEASKNIFIPSLQFWFDDIAYLGAPRGEEDQIEEMLDALQIAVWEGGEERITSPEELEALFADYTQMARDYGLDSCLVEAPLFTKG